MEVWGGLVVWWRAVGGGVDGAGWVVGLGGMRRQADMMCVCGRLDRSWGLMSCGTVDDWYAEAASLVLGMVLD